MALTNRSSRRGATLRDALIALVTATILLVLATLYFTRGTVQAGAAQSLANLRQLGEGFASYAAFQSGAWPFAQPGDPIPLAPGPSAPETSAGDDGRPVWILETLWFALVPVGDTWEAGAEIARSPGAEPVSFPLDGRPDAWDTPSSVSYHYSNAFLADPRAWPAQGVAGDAPAAGAALIRPTLVSEVAFPSRKALLYDHDRAYLRADPTPETTRPILFVDNSAFGRLDTGAATPVERLAPSGDGRWAWPTMRAWHDSARGVAGWDF